jgi:phosphoenolpyruvate carboxykinase (ATP)
MAKINLAKYGIKGVKEILYNPTYEVLYNEETKPGLEGFDKGQVTELGAINVIRDAEMRFCPFVNIGF